MELINIIIVVVSLLLILVVLKILKKILSLVFSVVVKKLSPIFSALNLVIQRIKKIMTPFFLVFGKVIFYAVWIGIIALVGSYIYWVFEDPSNAVVKILLPPAIYFFFIRRSSSSDFNQVSGYCSCGTKLRSTSDSYCDSCLSEADRL